MTPITPLRALALILLLLASGCVETRFESPLGDNIETCDARWKGLWIGDGDEAKKSDDPTAFYVNDDCEFTVIDQPEPGGALKRIHVPVNYVHDRGKDYIVVADTAIRDLVHLPAPHAIDPPPAKSFFFARYRASRDRIVLTPVDSEATAKLVIDGKVGGTVDKARNELHVYVRGTRAQMIDLVRAHDIFDEKASVKLVRSRESIDEYERSHVGVPKAKP